MPFLHDAYVLKCRLHMHVCLGTCVRVSDLVSMYACAAVKQIQHLFSCKSVKTELCPINIYMVAQVIWVEPLTYESLTC